MADMLPSMDLVQVAGGAWNAFGPIIALIVGGIILVFVARILIDRRDYNKRGLLIRKYGQSTIILDDLFKFVYDKKRNIRYYHGKKSKADIPADKFEEMIKNSENKDILVIDNTAYGEYKLMGINFDEKTGKSEIKHIPTADKKSWYVYSQKDNIRRFEILDWLSKYANVIALAGIVVLMMINFIFQGAVLDKTNGLATTIDQVSKNLMTMASEMKSSNEILDQVMDKGVNLTLMLRNLKNVNGTLQVIR